MCCTRFRMAFCCWVSPTMLLARLLTARVKSCGSSTRAGCGGAGGTASSASSRASLDGASGDIHANSAARRARTSSTDMPISNRSRMRRDTAAASAVKRMGLPWLATGMQSGNLRR